MVPVWTDEEIELVSELAYELHLQGKHEDALILFEGLIVIDPRNVYCLEALAVLNLRIGSAASALEYASRALAFSPRRVDTLACRCEAYLVQQRWAESDQDLQALKQLGATVQVMRLASRRAVLENFSTKLLPDATSRQLER